MNRGKALCSRHCRRGDELWNTWRVSRAAYEFGPNSACDKVAERAWRKNFADGRFSKVARQTFAKQIAGMSWDFKITSLSNVAFPSGIQMRKQETRLHIDRKKTFASKKFHFLYRFWLIGSGNPQVCLCSTSCAIQKSTPISRFVCTTVDQALRAHAMH